MATWRLALIPLWLFGCTLAAPAPAPAGDDGADGQAGPVDASHLGSLRDWQAVMQELDASCDDLQHWLLAQPQGDLARTAARARSAARAMRLGYGRFEDVSVAGFAGMARAAESWLLQVAIEAEQGHGDLAAERFRTGRGQHCTRCHDAHERVHG